MLLVTVRDKKLLELYQILTKSNMEGTIEDTEVVTLLYSTLCLDTALSENLHEKCEAYLVDSKHLFALSKELARIYEEAQKYDDYQKYSLMWWARALISYMDFEFLDYDKVHKTSTYELYINVAKYLEQTNEEIA